MFRRDGDTGAMWWGKSQKESQAEKKKDAEERLARMQAWRNMPEEAKMCAFFLANCFFTPLTFNPVLIRAQLHDLRCISACFMAQTVCLERQPSTDAEAFSRTDTMGWPCREAIKRRMYQLDKDWEKMPEHFQQALEMSALSAIMKQVQMKDPVAGRHPHAADHSDGNLWDYAIERELELLSIDKGLGRATKEPTSVVCPGPLHRAHACVPCTCATATTIPPRSQNTVNRCFCHRN